MDNKRTTQSKLSDKSAEFSSIAESVKKTVEKLPKFNFLSPVISDGLLDVVKQFSKPMFSDDFMDTINGVSKLQIECKEKRESNFYYAKEELSYKYGARHYKEFDEWYKKFIMFNPSYYDLPYGYILNTTDEVIQYTDPESNTTVKIIGVNSVAYELFAEYRDKQHEAQRQGLVWSDADETARMEKFIKDVGVKQPKQLQEPDESIHEKIIKEFDKRDIRLYLKNSDFIAFTDALANHLSNEEYILPNSIFLRSGAITKIATAVYHVHYLKKTSLVDDTKLFDLMRVLLSFKHKSDKQIYNDMQRTK